ncbi:MAG: NUDIX domain-containing protein [Chloroflexota bacterium]
MFIDHLTLLSISFVSALIPILIIIYFELSLRSRIQIATLGYQKLIDNRFSTLHDLKNWLVERKIDLSTWGKGDAKSLIDLWHEVISGDIHLEDNPLCRKVNVAVLIIQQEEKYLIEKEQIMSDQRVRQRSWPPSEKIQRDESLPTAVRRCLREELGVPGYAVEIIRMIPDARIESRTSPSYPGLETEYRLNVIEVRVSGLPQRAFETEEDRKNDTDPVRTHRWEWGELPPDLQHLLT